MTKEITSAPPELLEQAFMGCQKEMVLVIFHKNYPDSRVTPMDANEVDIQFDGQPIWGLWEIKRARKEEG